MRSLLFKDRPEDRYWWFKQAGNNYIPPIFSFLEDDEWKIIEDWYAETDSKKSAGESNIPAMSFLQGLIMGSRVQNIVQLGHYEGFSALLIGFMLKRMGIKNAFVSIDNDQEVTDFTQKWIDRANLQEYVKLLVGDSASPHFIDEVNNLFHGAAKLVFIDSSHQYDHTIRELELWYPNLEPQGLIALHDVSGFAIKYDKSEKGGVNKAIEDWSRKWGTQNFLLNGSVPGDSANPLDSVTYQDVNGLGLIQKKAQTKNS
jgi:predicted O-methyltransferase YrrM